MKMNRTKRNILLAGAISCVALAGVGSTMAYFTENASKVNTFTTGDLDIGLHESEWNPDEDDGKNVYPGYTVYKNPTIKNITSAENGDEPCYARMIVEILDTEGQPVTDSDALELIYKTIYYDPTFTGTYDKAEGTAEGLVEGKVPGYSLKELEKYSMVNSEWSKDLLRSTPEKQVYNYMGKDKDGILDIGEESTLFTNIVIPTDWNQTQFAKIGDYQLKVTAQAIQSKGFATQTEAFRMLDEEVKGGTLQQIVRGSGE